MSTPTVERMVLRTCPDPTLHPMAWDPGGNHTALLRDKGPTDRCSLLRHKGVAVAAAMLAETTTTGCRFPTTPLVFPQCKPNSDLMSILWHP